MNHYEALAMIASGVLAIILRKRSFGPNDQVWGRGVPKSARRLGEIMSIAIGALFVMIGLLGLFMD